MRGFRLAIAWENISACTADDVAGVCFSLAPFDQRFQYVLAVRFLQFECQVKPDNPVLIDFLVLAVANLSPVFKVIVLPWAGPCYGAKAAPVKNRVPARRRSGPSAGWRVAPRYLFRRHQTYCPTGQPPPSTGASASGMLKSGLKIPDLRSVICLGPTIAVYSVMRQRHHCSARHRIFR